LFATQLQQDVDLTETTETHRPKPSGVSVAVVLSRPTGITISTHQVQGYALALIMMVWMTGQMRLLSCMALAADGRPQLLAFLAAIGGIPVSPPRRGFVPSHTWATWMVSSRLQSITRLLLPQSCCEQQRYESRAQYWNRSQCLTGLSLSIALFPLPTCLLTVIAGYPGFSDGHPRIVTLFIRWVTTGLATAKSANGGEATRVTTSSQQHLVTASSAVARQSTRSSNSPSSTASGHSTHKIVRSKVSRELTYRSTRHGRTTTPNWHYPQPYPVS